MAPSITKELLPRDPTLCRLLLVAHGLGLHHIIFGSGICALRTRILAFLLKKAYSGPSNIHAHCIVQQALVEVALAIYCPSDTLLQAPSPPA